MKMGLIPTIIFLAFIRPAVLAVNELAAVSSLLGSEDFYVRIKRAAPNKIRPEGPIQKHDSDVWTRFQTEGKITPERDFSAKNEICGNIFGSDLFDMRAEDAIDVNGKEFKSRLQERNEKMYARVYESAVTVSGLEYGNPYLLRDFVVDGEPVSEYVFACLTRKRGTDGQIIEYFLSTIYNVNESTHTNAPFIGARFIFTDDAVANQLAVVAVAEEPATNSRINGLPMFLISGFDITQLYAEANDIVRAAKRMSRNELEMRDVLAILKRYASYVRRLGIKDIIDYTNHVYYKARNEVHEDEDVSSNLVCRMTPARHMRLCAVVFSAVEYRGKVQFWPRADRIEEGCQRKRVFASLPLSTIRMTYDEWMLGCKVVLVGSNELSTIYVARGVAPNSTIVYKRLDGSADTYVGDVGFVGVSLITGEGKRRPITEV